MNHDEPIPLDGVMISVSIVDKDGHWFSEEDGMGGDIRDLVYPVPDPMSGGPFEPQGVLAVILAREILTWCHCGRRVREDDLMLILDQFYVHLATCCGKLVWAHRMGHDVDYLEDI